MSAGVLRAPAKLNLGLRIVGRRADGYHLLESLFVPLDLCDEVAVAPDPTERLPGAVSLALEAGPPGLPSGDANLAARAARVFLEAAGLAVAVRVRLRKRIPVGAGLGGGSSDAAAVLRGLAELFPGALTPDRLAALALGLGADVPFFLDPRPARVGGIGEQIEPLAGVPSFGAIVVTPSPGLSTAEVFQAFDRGAGPPAGALTPPEPSRTLRRLPAIDWRALLAGGLDHELENALEPAATRLRPSIGRLRREIGRAGSRAAGMSGSGPSVYGLFGDLGTARAAAAGMRLEPSDRVHVGRTLGSHGSWGVV